jgi:hypothetical protein
MKNLFTNKPDLNLKKKLLKCYGWVIVQYSAETWTFRKADQTYPESFEMWCWRRVEVIWAYRVRNEVVLLRFKGERKSLHTINKGLTGSVTSCVGIVL